MRNKKGQTMGLAVISALAVLIVGLMFVNFLMPEVTQFRVDMDCTNSSISDGSKLTCLVGDVAVPYVIIVILSLATGAITARLAL